MIDAFLRCWMRTVGSLPGCRYRVSGACHMLDTGTSFKDENYALVSPDDISCGEIQDTVRESLAYFAGRPHSWPIVMRSRNAHELASSLLDAGGREDGKMWIMSSPPHSQKDDIAKSVCDEEVREWAEASWLGFDSSPPAADEYVDHISRLDKSDDITLLSLRCDGDITACGALISCDHPGIFYVSVVPRYRRCGLAKRIVGSLLALSSRRSNADVSLLATESGRYLYESCGFETLCEVSMITF